MEDHMIMNSQQNTQQHNSSSLSTSVLSYTKYTLPISTLNESTTTTSTTTSPSIARPDRTIYMDGIFDLFHIGHLSAIQQCAKLGNKVIIGITSDYDATNYKRQPIINEKERITIVSNIKYVDEVICPCPLVVTEDFIKENGIDLVVHGFVNEEDELRQYEFFKIAIELGKFKKIPYYEGQSTTDILKKIHGMSEEEEEKEKEKEGGGSGGGGGDNNKITITER